MIRLFDFRGRLIHLPEAKILYFMRRGLVSVLSRRARVYSARSVNIILSPGHTRITRASAGSGPAGDCLYLHDVIIVLDVW